MISLLMILVVFAVIAVILNVMNKCPLWVAVGLLAVAMFIQILPIK